MPSTAEASTPSTATPVYAELSAAVARLRADELVAYPTETVWGLAALARSETAAAALRRFKGRDERQPISILVPGSDDLAKLGFDVCDSAESLMQAFWPGPLTLILRCVESAFARGIARDSDFAVGVRCSAHPMAAALTLAAAHADLGPITATSLNRSGEPPANSRNAALALCSAVLEGPTVLADDAPSLADALPSTVVDLASGLPRILRAGAIDRSAIEKVVCPLADAEV